AVTRVELGALFQSGDDEDGIDLSGTSRSSGPAGESRPDDSGEIIIADLKAPRPEREGRRGAEADEQSRRQNGSRPRSSNRSVSQ
ncbi:MAG: hypothetical protein VXW22_08335, partial [Pseudomonadota bacterium]|nr:hypothetical protein [Pseudomonadota bacterium]